VRESLAVATRVIRELVRAPLALAAALIAPALLLVLLNAVLGVPPATPLILTDGMPTDFDAALAEAGTHTASAGYDVAMQRLSTGEADGFVTTRDDIVIVWVEGTDPARSDTVVRAVRQAQLASLVSLTFDPKPIELPGGLEIDIAKYLPVPELDVPDEPEVRSVHGSTAIRSFDFYAPALLGVIALVFAGIGGASAIARERASGALGRVLALPVRRWAVVLGWTFGYALLALAQSAIVVLLGAWGLGVPNSGSIWLAGFVVWSMALVGLLLGHLVATNTAGSGGTMRLLLSVLTPVIALSGLFELAGAPIAVRYLSWLSPVTYGANALRDVMLRGAGTDIVWLDLSVLWVWITALFTAGVLSLGRRDAPGRCSY